MTMAPERMTAATVLGSCSLAALIALGCGGSSPKAVGSPGAAGSTGNAGSSGSAGNSGSSGSAGIAPPPNVSSTLAMAAKTCADEPLATTGTIYYACDCGTNADKDCKVGDDTNAGTDPAKPWRTFSKAQGQFSTLKPGDTLAFCQGGSFTSKDQSMWTNLACKVATPCTVRNYTPPWASGDEGLPKLVGAGWALSNAAKATHEEGYRFLNLELDGPGSGDGINVYNDTKDVLLCNLLITGFTTGVNIEGSNPPADASSDGKNARITLRGSRLINNVEFGYLGACDGCVVEYNYFDHNGKADPLDHSIYFGGARDGNGVLYSTQGMRATGNEMYHTAMGTGPVCQGVVIVVHGQHDGLVIQANTIVQELGQSDVGCWGIGLLPGYGADPERFTNATIIGNKVINVGNTSIGISSCQNCIVEDNLIVQGQPKFGAGGITAHPNGTRDAIDGALDAAQILNNSIFFGADVQNTGIIVGGEGTNHVIAGNAVMGSGTKEWGCLDFDLAASAYDSDHNLCWNALDPNGQWEVGSGALAAWQMKTGLDMHSIDADPMYTHAASMDYDLTAMMGSPLIGAGDPTHGSTLDFSGAMRASPPDIGAYQH
jgi:hypothetical protein